LRNRAFMAKSNYENAAKPPKRSVEQNDVLGCTGQFCSARYFFLRLIGFLSVLARAQLVISRAN
jgi:hypothetical protein